MIMLLCVRAHAQTHARPRLQYFDFFNTTHVAYMNQYGLYFRPPNMPHQCLYALAQSDSNLSISIETGTIIAIAYHDSCFLINIDGQLQSLKMKQSQLDLTAKTDKYRVRLYCSYCTKGGYEEPSWDRFVITNIVTGLKTEGKLYTECY